jgi:hypothetical protein
MFFCSNGCWLYFLWLVGEYSRHSSTFTGVLLW